MKTQKIFLFVGILLVILSVQDEMFKEIVYQWQMEQRYEITEINEMYSGASPRYEFGSKTIETTHKSEGEPPFLDPWNKITELGDVYISIDGKIEETLEYFPVSYEEGLNKYLPYVSYWLIYDKKTDEKTFAIVLQTTREIMRTMDGYIPQEEQDYRIITISEKGKLKKKIFHI